jgi:hypothetical protein
MATTRKFIEGKITEEDRDLQLVDISRKINVLEQEKVEMDRYVKEKERIVEDATSFISTPDIFWNRANTRVRQAIQRLLFPAGIIYDFETGFGTTEQINSYLLLQKIAENSAINYSLVAGAGQRFPRAAHSSLLRGRQSRRYAEPSWLESGFHDQNKSPTFVGHLFW